MTKHNVLLEAEQMARIIVMQDERIQALESQLSVLSSLNDYYSKKVEMLDDRVFDTDKMNAELDAILQEQERRSEERHGNQTLQMLDC